MMDSRIQQLAKNLVNYSINLKKDEKVLIEVINDAAPLAKALVAEVYKVGAIPFITIENTQLQRVLLQNCSVEQAKMNAEWGVQRISAMDAYIAIRSSNNVSEMSDVPSDKLQIFQNYWNKPIHTELHATKTKWCVLRYPTASMAQLANTSTEAFEQFYFDVCNLNYAKMANSMTPLVELMEKTDKVRITGPGTDLTFSIKDIPAIKCCGLRNIPDGEVFTAPVRTSINGCLTYNTTSMYQGFAYENIQLEFKDGKIVKATANNSEKINQVLDTDDGARYIGEFSFGLNPYISSPMKATLFDEKIKGSFHLTPGNAYNEAFNGNKSAIHWDLVCIQTPECGGGEIWFDDVLIRKDGRFVVPELEGLNPENLV